MWGSWGAPNLSAITALADKEDTTVETILDDPALTAAMRNGISAIVRFITKPSNLNCLLDMAIGGLTPQTPAPNKTIRMAVSVLTTSTSCIIKEILKDDGFKDRIANFVKSEWITNERACGHYCRIVESALSYTKGKYMENLSILKEYLTTDMSCAGLRQLFVTMITEHHKALKITPEMIAQMAKSSNRNNGFFSISALKSIAIHKKFQHLFLIPETIRAILSIATNDDIRPVVSIEAFRLIQILIPKLHDNEEITAVIREFGNSYDFSKGRDTAITAIALSVFKGINESIFTDIISSNKFSNYQLGCLEALQANSKSQKFADLVSQNNICEKIIESYPNVSKGNPYLTNLAVIINESGTPTDEKWEEFSKGVLKQKLEARECTYGGDYPKPPVMDNVESSSEDSEDSSDGENIFPNTDSESSDSDSDSESDSEDSGEIPPPAQGRGSALDDSTSSSDEEDSSDNVPLPKALNSSPLRVMVNDSDDSYSSEDDLPKPKAMNHNASSSSDDSDDDIPKPIQSNVKSDSSDSSDTSSEDGD